MQQGFKSATDAGERVGGNVHGKAEALAGGVHKAATQVFAVGKGHGVHEDVQVAPFFLDEVGGGLNLRVIAHIALEGEFTAKLFAQGVNAFFDGIAYIVECQAGTLFLKGIGNAVSDTSIIGQTQYKSFLSLQQHGSS